MEILGIGVDIVEVQRIRKTVERFGSRFLNRVFTSGEIETCMARALWDQCLAARFAAKEAFMKALGSGMRGGTFKEIEVWNTESGSPAIRLHGKLGNLLENRTILVSLTHTKTYAAAIVVIQRKNKGA